MDTATLLRNLERPNKKVDVVLDTDAYNEIDDQYAIAYMLCNPEKLNVKAIYAAPFYGAKASSAKMGMEKSYDEIKKVLGLMKYTRLDNEIYKGSESFMSDDKIPVVSPAAEHLAKFAENYSPENPLYVIAIGAITNVASAILLNPAITENIVIVWLGGHALHWGDCREFNLINDVSAARVVFGCGAPLVQLPCFGVVTNFTISGAELEKWLLGKNDICTYLAQNTIDEANEYANGKPWTRVIWDVTAVAWLIDGCFMDERIERSPVPTYDGNYAYEGNRHFYKYVYNINRDSLCDHLFHKLTSYSPPSLITA